MMALTVSEYHLGALAQSFSPQARTAARTPSASRRWRAKIASRPSSRMMPRDSRRPYSIGMEGVYGKYPVAFALIMSPKSKNTRGHLACSRAASALGLAHTIPRPAGSIRPFCEPVIARSTFHSSMRKSIDPTELTPSTYSSAGCWAASMARRTAPRSLVTPVAGRQCVDEGRFPPAGAGRRKDEWLGSGRLEHLLQVAEQSGRQVGERRRAVILHRTIHRAEDALGYVGRPWNEQEVTAGHKVVLDERGKTKREPSALASPIRLSYAATLAPQPHGWVGAGPPYGEGP